LYNFPLQVESRRPHSSHAGQPLESTRGPEQERTCGASIQQHAQDTGASPGERHTGTQRYPSPQTGCLLTCSRCGRSDLGCQGGQCSSGSGSRGILRTGVGSGIKELHAGVLGWPWHCTLLHSGGGKCNGDLNLPIRFSKGLPRQTDRAVSHQPSACCAKEQHLQNTMLMIQLGMALFRLVYLKRDGL